MGSLSQWRNRMSDLEHNTIIKVHVDGLVTLVIGQANEENLTIYLTDQTGDDILTIEVEAMEIRR